MKIKEKVGVVSVRLALAVLAGAVIVPAHAQTQDAKPAEKKEDASAQHKVDVTGTRIRRVNAETASPVTIITKDELTRGGATSLNEALRNIAANVGGVDDTRAGGFTSGAASLNLRGIGTQATLTLINGRRLASYAQPDFQTTFVDLNSVPIGAVERIEILKDGASAIYGSEAMAGVVNIIMRESFEGIEVGGSYAMSERSDGEQGRATVTFGKGSLVQDRFNVYATVDLRKFKPMLLSKRDDYLGTQDFRPWGYRDNRNLYTSPGNLYWTDRATGKFVARPIEGGSCPADRLVPADNFFGAGNSIGTVCVFDDIKDSTYNAAGYSERVGLTSRATWAISPTTTAWAEVMWHQNRSSLQGLPHWVAGQNGATHPALPITHPQYPKDLIDPVTGRTLAGGNGTVRVRAQLTDFPGQGQNNETNFGRYLAAIKGTVGNWDWEAGALWTGSHVESRRTSGLLRTPFVNAYRNGTFLFGKSYDNQALLSQILTNTASFYKSSVTQFDAKISGELFTLPAGAVGVAVGVEARKEKLTTNPDPVAVRGELYNNAQLPPGFTNDREVKSIYAEANVPVIKSLEAQLAVRHDRYSDYGTSTTPKVGVKWTPLSTFAMRGTYAEGFRAPTLVENSNDIRKAFISFRDPARCNDRFKVGCNDQSPYESGANPALKPETAKSFTVGAVYEPFTWLNASVDLWRIKREDEISTLDLQKVLQDPSRYAGNPAVAIVRDPITAADQAAGATAGEITLIRMLLTNVSVTDIRGVDLDLKAKFNMGEWGIFEPQLQWTRYHSYKHAPSPDDDLIEYAGTRGTPKNTANLRTVWKKAAWQVSADVNHIGKMASVDDFTLPCTFRTEGYPELCNGIKSFTTVNLGVKYKGFSFAKDLVVGLIVENAFDKKPPFHYYSSRGLGYYAPLHSPRGRYFQVRFDYKFD